MKNTVCQYFHSPAFQSHAHTYTYTHWDWNAMYCVSMCFLTCRVNGQNTELPKSVKRSNTKLELRIKHSNWTNGKVQFTSPFFGGKFGTTDAPTNARCSVEKAIVFPGMYIPLGLGRKKKQNRKAPDNCQRKTTIGVDQTFYPDPHVPLCVRFLFTYRLLQWRLTAAMQAGNRLHTDIITVERATLITAVSALIKTQAACWRQRSSFAIADDHQKNRLSLFLPLSLSSASYSPSYSKQQTSQLIWKTTSDTRAHVYKQLVEVTGQCRWQLLFKSPSHAGIVRELTKLTHSSKKSGSQVIIVDRRWPNLLRLCSGSVQRAERLKIQNPREDRSPLSLQILRELRESSPDVLPSRREIVSQPAAIAFWSDLSRAELEWFYHFRSPS